MPKSFRERVDVTSTIRSILDSYPLGNGILRELLQNSDDAGATEQTFILDMRCHPTKTLVDVELAHSQGPALLAVNNSCFTARDWVAIRTIHNSSKTQDERKIGKFGIGVRACYHLTDNPHFLSGGTLGIFDPHDRFTGLGVGGLEIDLAHEASQFHDQLVPFADLLGSKDFFPGTIVRLPLRTVEQAPRSTIKQTAVEASEIVTLFRDFVEKELSVVMLFLKHVRSIRLKVIDAGGVETFIGGAEIPDPSISGKRAFFPDNAPSSTTFRCTINVETPGGKTAKAWRLFHSIGSTSDAAAVLGGLLGYHVETELLVKDKLFSHVALAFPIDQDQGLDGRLFTLLPLPIFTRFPVHFHGILALTQDRQSLRNIEEIGTGPRSREGFLVAWNRAVFQEFLPAAWSQLLRILVEEGELKNAWLAWPTSDHVNDYWKEILPNLMNKVLASDLAVFPAYDKSGTCVELSSALIASPSDNKDVLMALSRVGLSVVQPPQHIQDVLRSRPGLTFLDPDSVRIELLACISAVAAASEDDQDDILEYLVLHPGTVHHAIGLPLISPISGPRISLATVAPGTPTRTLVTEAEEKVFGSDDGDLIPLSHMSARVEKAFSSVTGVNVTRLNDVKVHHYLTKRFQDPDLAKKAVEEKVQWLARFWEWMSTSPWTCKADLLMSTSQLYLLPTSQGSLRQMHSRVALPVGDPATQRAWSMLGVDFLHPHLVPYQSAFQGAVVRSDDIAFLVETVSPDLVHTLDEPSAQLIQAHIIRCISSLQASLGRRTPAQRDAFMRNFIQLRIFPTRVVADERESALSVLKLDVASGDLVYIHGDDGFPVPDIQNLRFFDVTADRGIGMQLGDIINPNRKVLNQAKVLEMAVSHLRTQTPRNQDALLTHIIRRLPELSLEAKTKLQTVPFVSVNGWSHKVAPNRVIDPGSALASIYQDEHGQFPEAPWGTEYLAMLTSQGFFLRELTSDIVAERIRYLSGGADDASFLMKARKFLALLDTQWGSLASTTTLAEHLSTKWLPARFKKSFELMAPNACRDSHGDSGYLFDLVVPLVGTTIRDKHLRAALGWTEIPVPVLLSQLRATLRSPDNRRDRLSALIKEFARRFAHSHLTAQEFDDLNAAVSGRPWIPVSGQPDPVQTKYALLQRPGDRQPSRFSLTSRFKAVPKELLDENGRAFLTAMGCLEKPSLDTLVAELELLADHTSNRSSIALEAVDILAEVAGMIQDSDADQALERLRVPGADDILRPIAEVYFEDTLSDFRTTHLHAVHPNISRAVAQKIAIPFLSHLELGNEDDDMQMGEDFTRRVRGVLAEYDVQYALNEYLANAIDAKATEFSITLDERTFESSRVFTSRLGDLQRRPSILLFNNAVVKPEDFRGLRMVGQGGKGSDPDTIGRYGLGALSLFHFTDVVQLISGNSLLILDPSGFYLPPLKGKPRTALKMSLADVFRRYPDHLSCFDSLHGFSKSSAYYKGTLFRLPLRNEKNDISSTPRSISDCQNLLNGPYHGLAKDAMYFTSLERVSAGHREPLGDTHMLWSTSASRGAETVVENPAGTELRISTLRLNDHEWLLTKSITPLSAVPAEHDGVLAEMKLNTTRIGLVVQMAFPLGGPGNLKHYLFSSLRLPITSSLPAHIHAQFALSSDRRHIRFEPADESGTRPPQAAYNHWIISELITPLYISSIAHVPESVLDSEAGRFAWWPTADMLGDEISSTIVREFYALLPASPVPMCYSITGARIPPMGARFCGIDTSPRIITILRVLKCSNVVYLYRGEISSLAFPSESPSESHLPVVDPAFVKEVLVGRRAALAKRFTDKKIDAEDIETLLLFLLQGGLSVVDLPLFLQDGNLVSLRQGSPVMYALSSRYSSVANAIFPRNRFIRVHREAQDILFERTDVTIRPFDETGVLTLLKEQIPHISRCPRSGITNDGLVANFWDSYERLPGPPKTASLEQLALVATTTKEEYLSAVYCRDGLDAISQPAIGEIDDVLVAAMQRLDVVFYRLPPPFAADYAKGLDFATCIKAIKRRSDRIPLLPTVEGQHLCNWIQNRVYYSTEAEKVVVQSLPIWQAFRGGGRVLLSVADPDLEMLPFPTLDLETFTDFLRTTTALARYSLPLETVLRWSPTRRSSSSVDLANVLSLPGSLNTHNMDRYLRLFETFLSLQDGDWQLPVPDGNLVLRPVEALYDHSNSLFAEVLSLERSDRDLFLHPSFRYLNVQLRSKGLKTEVDWDSFLQSARFIQTALLHRSLPDNTLVAKAGIVYDFYNTPGCPLPTEVKAETTKLEQLSRIPFIPRAPQRSNASFGFDPEPYCLPLPVVVSPAQVVRREHEQIVWTQRALFRDQPGPTLGFNHPWLGIPQVEEVVAHLTVLATIIAPQHDRDQILLQHLQATYHWLNRNTEAARPHLLSAAGAVFLNVDDPLSQSWEWRSAQQLLLDVTYDWPETNTFAVRRFLQSYRPLLLAAGADSEHAVDYKPRTTATDGNTLRAAFDRMRRAGQLTDVLLMPSDMMDEEMKAEDRKLLRAHSTFLAAAIPHVLDGLLGWSEGTSAVYSFPGTYFGACAVLEFVYTGEIEPDPMQTGDGHMDLMRDLLELLSAADAWNMPELRDEIGRLVKKFNLLSRDTYQTIMETAEKYGAASLFEYCREWGEKNPTAVRRANQQ
ncbi:hypothetical protein C8R46DRAFT_1190033 [Mycena filopes]|nr:hypothetical protein C8R46DRAFT_1190033 [Mycena filopes]